MKSRIVALATTIMISAAALTGCSSAPSDPAAKAQWEQLKVVITAVEGLVNRYPDDIGADLDPWISEAKNVADDTSLDVTDYLQAACALYAAGFDAEADITDQITAYDNLECDASKI